VLFFISMLDSHQSVRTLASDWLKNPTVQDLKYRLDRDMTNPFGQTWDPLGSVTAIVASIDEKTSQTIGLTAMQMSNLSVETAMGISIVTSTERIQIDQYYNAFGEQASGGAGIRISKDLAEQLHIGIGDSITLVSEGGTSVVPA
jgi:ABC-type lipoprotein release transport system permease subunit